MNPKIVAVAAIITLISGCGHKPKLLKHYKEADASSAYPSDLQLTGFSVDPGQNPGSLPISLLSDRAQAELMKAMTSGAAPMPASSVLAAISKPPESRRPCAWADRTSIRRRVYFTTSGGMKSVADRIDRSEITMDIESVLLPDNTTLIPAKFVGWDRFDTQYATYNVGNATFVQTDKMTIGRDATTTRNVPAPGGSDVTLFKFGAETTDQLTEAVNFAMRRISISGTLQEAKASIIQEGAPNFNLMGSVSALVNIRIESQKDTVIAYDMTLGSAAEPKEPGAVNIERCNASLPAVGEAVRARISGDYYIREVKAGQQTIPEGDDVVVYRKASASGGVVEIVPTELMGKDTFVLAACKPGEMPHECDRLLIDAPEATSRSGRESVRLISLDKAAELKLWIDRMTKKHGKISAIGGREIGIGHPGGTTPLDGIDRKGYARLIVLAESP